MCTLGKTQKGKHLSRIYSSTFAKKAQRKRKATIYKWLRDRTSDIDIGRFMDGSPKHLNYNEYVLRMFNKGHWFLKETMKNVMFDQHFDGSACPALHICDLNVSACHHPTRKDSYQVFVLGGVGNPSHRFG